MIAPGRLIGQGGEAEVFATEDGMALKLMRSAAAADRLGREVVALRAAAAAGVRVPLVMRQVEVDGRPGVVMQRIEGVDLLTLIGRRPWSVFAAGKLTGQAHAKINGAAAPADLPSVQTAAHQVLQQRCEEEPSPEFDWALRVLTSLPEGDRLCHGDFHPGQMMVEAGEGVVLDWLTAKRGNPLFDHALTCVTLRMGATPPGTSAALRALALVGRELLTGRYVRSYRASSPSPIDAKTVLAWEVVALVYRLGVGRPGESARLRARLGRLYARRKALGLPI